MVALTVAPVLTTKISEAERSVIVSLPASILKVSEPAPPVMMSSPAPPVIMSTPSPPMMVSIPSPPVMVNPSVCALKFTLEPAVLARTVSIFLKLASEAKTCEPADNCKVSAPPAPSKTSRFPCPEDAMVNVSAFPVAVMVSVPELPIRLNPFEPAADVKSTVKPPVPRVKLAVPSFLASVVAV